MSSFFDDEPDWALDDDFGDDGDDENPSNDGEEKHAGAEHLLLLLDCDDSMFERYVPCLVEGSVGDDGGEETEFVSPMEVAVTTAHRFLRTKIRDIAETKTGKRDGVGVLLYGCDPQRAMRAKSPRSTGSGEDSEGSEEKDELPTTHELIELYPPGIEQVLAMQECLPRENPNQRQRNLRKEFSAGKRDGERGEEEDAVCSLLQGLTAAMKIFGNSKCVKSPGPSSKSLPDSKALWIFTNQEDPCHGDENQKSRLMTVKKDCQEAEIAIHVLPLPKKSSEGADDEQSSRFDQEIFYNDLTATYSRVEDVRDSDSGAVDIEAFVDRFRFGAKKRRKHVTVPLLLPGWKEREGDPGIMLDLYGIVQVRQRPKKYSVHQENNKMTTSQTKRVITESGEEVLPEDIHNFVEWGGRVSMQPANLAMMKRVSNSLDEPGLAIYGFRKMKHLPTTNLIKNSYLALANDTRVEGSAKALYNLKLSMIKKGVFAVGEFLYRRTSSSSMVALVPKNDDSGDFIMTYLPFKEDVRAVPQNDIVFADRNSVDAAKGLIAKSQLHFEDFVECLPANPYLRHFFGYLESVTLGKPLLEVEDDAKMDVEGMLERASEEIESFSLSLPEDEVPVKKDRKRKAPSSSTNREFVKEPISEEWIEMYKNDEIASLKNDELKAFLRAQGLNLGGKKADLVDRCHKCIDQAIFKG